MTLSKKLKNSDEYTSFVISASTIATTGGSNAQIVPYIILPSLVVFSQFLQLFHYL